MSSSMVHVRIDEDVKLNATAALAKMGLSVSVAIRLMLVRVAREQALPFEVAVPNAATVKAMRSADARRGRRFTTARELLEDLGV